VRRWAAARARVYHRGVLSRGVPEGLDPATTQRVMRSFLLVRIVHGALVLLFLSLAVLGVVERGWPRSVVAVLVIGIMWQVGRLVADCRRYARTRP